MSTIYINRLTKFSMHLISTIHTGEIPKEIFRLHKLEKLWMESNKFSGQIPRDIGALTALRELYLDQNPLTGMF